MKKMIMISMAVFFTIISLKAQVGVPSSGGEGSGAGGFSSYSFGQVVYTSVGNQISMAQGVQQSFDGLPKKKTVSKFIAKLVGEKAPTLLSKPVVFAAMVYPNPTTDKIILALDLSKTPGLHYVLYDNKGSVIVTNLISQNQTGISLQNLAGGLYIMKLYQHAIELKSFKIIKK